MGEWFKWITPKGFDKIRFERLMWLKIVGLPLYLWSSENLTKFGNQFGKTLETSTNLWESADKSSINIHILMLDLYIDRLQKENQ